jgi:hypothetical protein
MGEELMKNEDMKALLELEKKLSIIKGQLESGTPMGLDMLWNLTLQAQNITLKLMDNLYESSNTIGEDE